MNGYYRHPIDSEMEMFARVFSRDTGVKIVFGQGFSTDGKVITIIRLLDSADEWVRFEIEMGVYHETGHVITKDFPTFKRYTKENKTKAKIFNVVRDVTIEGHTMEKRWPGMKEKWDRFLSWYVENRTNPAIASGQVRPFQMLMWATYFRAREIQHSKSFGPGIILPAPVEEIFERRLAPFIQEIAEHDNIPHSMNLTERIYEEIMKEPPPPPPPPQPQQSGDDDNEQPQSGGDDEQPQGGASDDGTPEEWEDQDDQQQSGGASDESEDDESDEQPEDGDESGDDEQSEDDDEGEETTVNSSDDSDEEEETSENKEEGDSEDDSNDDSEDEPEDADDSEDKDEGDSEDDSNDDSNDDSEDDIEGTNSGGSGDNDASDDDDSNTDDGNGDNSDNEPEDEPEDEPEEPFSDEAEEALKDAQDEAEDDPECKTVGDDIADDVNKYANNNHVYREIAGLKERVIKANPRYGWEKEVAGYEAEGHKMTGYLGTKMKVLFISEKAPVTHRNLKYGKLDCKNLWKTKVGSLEVMKKKTPSSFEDSAVSMVVDNSQSMTEGNKAKITHSLLSSLGSDLEKLRIPFESIGFTTQPASSKGLANQGIRTFPITINLMKEFHEPYRLVRHRFVWPSGCLFTAELPALKFATERLIQRKETKKVLFLMTDGETYFGNSNLENAMQEATTDYIRRMKRAGIKVVLIGIQSSDVLVYDEDAIVLHDLNVFANEFYQNLLKLLL